MKHDILQHYTKNENKKLKAKAMVRNAQKGERAEGKSFDKWFYSVDKV